MNWYLEVFKKYAKFSGRARRREYWMFALFNLIISFALIFIDRFGLPLLSSIYQLAIVIPGIAVGVRRMHDTDRSGWWWIVPVIPLVFAVKQGTRGDNRFGPDPKAVLRSA